MTKDEALKILDEVMASMQSYYSANEQDLQDWAYDLQQVFNSVNEGWEVE